MGNSLTKEPRQSDTIGTERIPPTVACSTAPNIQRPQFLPFAGDAGCWAPFVMPHASTGGLLSEIPNVEVHEVPLVGNLSATVSIRTCGSRKNRLGVVSRTGPRFDKMGDSLPLHLNRARKKSVSHISTVCFAHTHCGRCVSLIQVDSSREFSVSLLLFQGFTFLRCTVSRSTKVGTLADIAASPSVLAFEYAFPSPASRGGGEGNELWGFSSTVAT